jgi:hypothetical protein
MNMGSTDSPPTYPRQNSSFKAVGVAVRVVDEEAGAKAAAEVKRDAKMILFIVDEYEIKEYGFVREREKHKSHTEWLRNWWYVARNRFQCGIVDCSDTLCAG